MAQQTGEMEVEAFLADSVQTTAESKLYVIGAGWNAINTFQMPMQHDRIGVGIVIRVPYTSTNQPHRFDIRLESADGEAVSLAEVPEGAVIPEAASDFVEDGKLMRLGGQFNVGRPPTIQPGDDQLVPLAVNIDRLIFEKPGSYVFVLSIDGTPVKRLPFRVVLMTNVGPVFA